jgi:prepilin peptidase CpaA
MGWAGLADALLGIGIAFAVYFALFALHAVGAGDVKLMMTVGALAGPRHWLTIFILASLTGGVLAIGLLVWRGKLLPALRNVLFIVSQLVRLRAPYRSDARLDVAHPNAIKLPHAVSIAIGALLFLAFAA